MFEENQPTAHYPDLTIQHQMSLIPGAINRVKEVAEPLKVPFSEEARMCAEILMAQAAMLRPLIADERIGKSELVKNSGGGDSHNPFENFDQIGGNVSEEILRKSKISGVFARIEEKEKWEQMTQGNPNRLIVVDPTDGSSKVGKLKKGIGSGLAIYRYAGQFSCRGDSEPFYRWKGDHHS